MTQPFAAKASQPLTFFVVAQLLQAVAGQQAQYIVSDLDAKVAFGFQDEAQVQPEYFIEAGTFAPTSTAYALPKNAALWTVVFDTATSALRIDGIPVITTAAGANVLDGLTIGSNSSFDGASGSSAAVNGYIGEILLYGGRLTPPEVTTIESYLKTKWGTP